MRCIDRPYVCETCEFRFDDLDALRLHKRKNEGVCDSYSPFDHHLYSRHSLQKIKVKKLSAFFFAYSCQKKIRMTLIFQTDCCDDNLVKLEPKYEEPMPKLFKIEPFSSDTGISSNQELASLESLAGNDPERPLLDQGSPSKGDKGEKFDDRFDPLNDDNESDIDSSNEIETPSPSKVREVRVRVKARIYNYVIYSLEYNFI